MAKLTVEYRCGHEVEEVRYGGKYTEQLDYAKEHHVCPSCYQAQKVAERDVRSAALQQSLVDLPMAALEGSEKQVKWANDIRATMLTEIRSMLDKIKPEQRELVATVVDRLAQKSAAKYWIDNRDQQALKLAADLAKAEGII